MALAIKSSLVDMDIGDMIPCRYTATEIGLGAWPHTNEYDKYIIKSNLNNKITPGDDSIWNYKNIYSMTQNTPIYGAWYDRYGNTATSADNTRRIVRGNINRGAWVDVNYWISNGVSTMLGFRPVLEYIEPTNKATTLYY